MIQPDRIQALIDDYLATDPDAMARTLRGGWSARPLELSEARPPVPPYLLCPSCERNAITRNGRCEECQWAVS